MLQTHLPSHILRLLFGLTHALYRVTDTLPRDEVLRDSLRWKANELLELLMLFHYQGGGEKEVSVVLIKIYIMNEYLELVRSTSNILPANLVVLKREYGAIAEYFAERLKSNRLVESEVTDRVEPADVERPKESDAMPVKPLPVKKDIHPISGGSSQLSDRQNTIIEFIRKNGRAKISDFVASLANVSSKTIQRDLQDLVSRDVLKKEGEKRWTTYSMNI